ncbi:hypothetical protein V1279_003107 [Bradyrhizobium sp. AZCC 1610]|uniref:hypothetical protein n=1 Tax=Bradyrhizobium sp. AZCC 1610 TaxID=3117020 RepID=UPI002FF2294A
MKSPFEYRSYVIRAEDGRYTAKSLDGETCTLQSRFLLRTLRAVDTLWTLVEQASSISGLPAWFSSYLNNPTKAVDLDEAASASEELAPECSKDSVDPISMLRFPKAPIRAIASAVAAASTAAAACIVQLTSQAAPIMPLAMA